MIERILTRMSMKRQRSAVLCAVPVVLAGLVYLNALQNPFVWDDFRTVATNRSLETPSNLRAIVVGDVTRPLVSLSYALDRAVWGPAPLGFHVTSVLLHMANVLLLFQLVRRLVLDVEESAAGHASLLTVGADVIAFSAAVLLAVHPLGTEAVGYISARADVLCTTFLLLAFLAMRTWIRGGHQVWLVSSGTCWLLALASKEIAIVFPLLLAGFGFFVARGTATSGAGRLNLLVLPFAALTGVFVIGRLTVLLLLEYPTHGGVRWGHLLVNADVIRQYLLLVASPARQSVFHAVTGFSGVFSLRTLLAMAVLGGFVALAWRSVRIHGLIGFGLAWFLVALSPPAVLVLLDLAHPMAEHRTYLANCGLFMATAVFICAVRAILSRSRPAVRILGSAALAMGVVALSGATIVRNAVWGNPVVLWQDALQKSPGIWLPHLLLGEALHEQGAHDRAVAEYRTAGRLRPDHSNTFMKEGICLTELNRLGEAAFAFSMAHRLEPRSAAPSTALGSVALLAGDFGEARQHFDQALHADPRNVVAMQSLALLNEQTSNPIEALRLCEQIASLAPDTPGNADCLRRNRQRLAEQAPQ